MRSQPPLDPERLATNAMLLRRVGLFALSSCLLIAGARSGASSQDPCEHLPLFSFYDEAGVYGRTEGGSVLSLTADLHAADCGTPDCYGAKILLTLELRPGAGRCVLDKASATVVDFFGPGCSAFASEARAAAYTYGIEPKGADLASESLSKLVLRDTNLGGALVILPDQFFFFERVEDPAILRAALDPGEVESPCCWGASSARLQRLRSSRSDKE